MLTFIKKHYEKLILAIFLIVFIIMLILQIRIITASLDVKMKDLEIEKKDPDYRNLDFSEFQALEQLSDTPKWVASDARDKMDRDYTDLCVAIESARCPFCERVIPTTNFTIDHKCSWCGKKLPTPENIGGAPSVDADDDEDGIPNQVEIELGLDMNDPNDAHYDLDEDGFTNLYEYKVSKTNPIDPKSRPPLAFRLQVLDVKRSRLPLIVKSVKTSGGDDKSKWLIHVEDLRKKRTRFWALNDEVKVGGERFKVINVDHRVTEKFSKRTKIVRKIDRSVITLQKVGEDGQPTEAPLINAVVGRPVYDPTIYALLGDVVTKQLFRQLSAESVFKIGSEKVGFEKYQVINIHPNAKKVDLKRTTLTGEPIGDVIAVTNKRRIPKISENQPKTRMGPDMDMPPLPPELLRSDEFPRGRRRRQ